LPPATTNSAGVLVLTNNFGDLNDDSQVNVLDVVLLTRHLNGTETLPPDRQPRADLDQDGAATDTDRVAIGDMIVNLRTASEEDFDDDDLPNAEEIRRGTNPFQPDCDHDGWMDGLEVADGTDPLSAESHGRLLAYGQPPVVVINPSLDAWGAGESAVTVAQPPVQTVFAEPDTKDGSEVFVASPPVETILPDPDPSEGTEVFVANPPVQATMPAPDDKDGPDVLVGNPPVQVLLPDSDEAIGGQAFLANPPLQILLPDLDLIGAWEFGPYLANPPLTIRILQP
jgi:hypothetical protein